MGTASGAKARVSAWALAAPPAPSRRADGGRGLQREDVAVWSREVEGDRPAVAAIGDGDIPACASTPPVPPCHGDHGYARWTEPLRRLRHFLSRRAEARRRTTPLLPRLREVRRRPGCQASRARAVTAGRRTAGWPEPRGPRPRVAVTRPEEPRGRVSAPERLATHVLEESVVLERTGVLNAAQAVWGPVGCQRPVRGRTGAVSAVMPHRSSTPRARPCPASTARHGRSPPGSRCVRPSARVGAVGWPLRASPPRRAADHAWWWAPRQRQSRTARRRRSRDHEPRRIGTQAPDRGAVPPVFCSVTCVTRIGRIAGTDASRPCIGRGDRTTNDARRSAAAPRGVARCRGRRGPVALPCRIRPG
jgi:hypothetical protein